MPPEYKIHPNRGERAKPARWLTLSTHWLTTRLTWPSEDGFNLFYVRHVRGGPRGSGSTPGERGPPAETSTHQLPISVHTSAELSAATTSQLASSRIELNAKNIMRVINEKYYSRPKYIIIENSFLLHFITLTPLPREIISLGGYVTPLEYNIYY